MDKESCFCPAPIPTETLHLSRGVCRAPLTRENQPHPSGGICSLGGKGLYVMRQMSRAHFKALGTTRVGAFLVVTLPPSRWGGPTESTVWEAAGKLKVTGDGEDVEEMEEDVHSHDGRCTESCLGLDAPQLPFWPHWLLAHLEG